MIGPARGLERITFYLNPSMATGTGTISVTVNGVTSNTLAFTVDNTTPIYYIDVTNGNNSNNGRTTAAPFKDLYKFDKDYNPSGDSQYIAYVRAGTYTAVCPNISAAICTYAPNTPSGGASKEKALIAYPGESPVVNTTNMSYGFWYMPWDYPPYNPNNYYTFAKLETTGGATPFGNIAGDYVRIVGNYFHDYTQESDAGIVTFQSSAWSVVYGNFFKHNVSDTVANSHDLYIQTQTYTPRSWVSGDHASMNIDVAWNEITQFVDQTGGAHQADDFFISGHQNSTTYATHNIWVHGNYFHDNQGNTIYVADGYPDYQIYIYDNVLAINTGSGGGSPLQ